MQGGFDILTKFFMLVIFCNYYILDIIKYNMSMVDSIDYTKILPMAVESRVRRRGFVPSNGSSFTSATNNIIEIPVSAAAFLDTKHSFLRFNFLNTTGQTFGVDFGGGHSFISRLRILQAGTVISDCRQYNRLLSSIILPCQGSESNLASRSLKEGQRFANSAVAGGAGNTAVAGAAAEITGATINTPTNADDSTTAAAAGSNYVFSIPLLNGLLGTTQDKLVPLFLLNSAPVVIEITLESNQARVGTFGAAGVGAYTINDVRYFASLVETGPAVEEQIRMVQQQSGGRLVLNGVDYTHTPGNIAAGQIGRISIPVPVRKKSIKSVLFACASTSRAVAGESTRYTLSYSGHLNMSEYQLAFGSRRIPEVPIGCQYVAAGNLRFQATQAEEIAKCFGETNSAHGLGSLSRVNFCTDPGANVFMPAPSAGGAALNTFKFCPFGIDCEAFQPDGKGGGALESGIDTASTSTPLELILDIGASIGQNVAVDIYCVSDSIYFIDSVGNLRSAM